MHTGALKSWREGVGGDPGVGMSEFYNLILCTGSSLVKPCYLLLQCHLFFLVYPSTYVWRRRNFTCFEMLRGSVGGYRFSMRLFLHAESTCTLITRQEVSRSETLPQMGHRP